MTTILVGTDSSSAADLAVDDAARLARDRGAELLVLLVRPDGDVRAAVDPDRAADSGRYLAELTRRFPEVDMTTRIERGEPADRICEVAAEIGADTIVVGNRGTRGVMVAREGQRAEPRAAALAVQRVHRRHEEGAVRVPGPRRRLGSSGSTQAARQSGAGNGSAQYAVSFAIFPSRISKMNTAWYTAPPP